MSAETLFNLCTAAPSARNAAPDKSGGRRRGELKQSGVLLLSMKIPGAVYQAPGILLRCNKTIQTEVNLLYRKIGLSGGDF